MNHLLEKKEQMNYEEHMNYFKERTYMNYQLLTESHYEL